MTDPAGLRLNTDTSSNAFGRRSIAHTASPSTRLVISGAIRANPPWPAGEPGDRTKTQLASLGPYFRTQRRSYSGVPVGTPWIATRGAFTEPEDFSASSPASAP